MNRVFVVRVWLAVVLSVGLIPAVRIAAAVPAGRREISLNTGWRFQRQVHRGSEVEWQFRDASPGLRRFGLVESFPATFLGPGGAWPLGSRASLARHRLVPQAVRSARSERRPEGLSRIRRRLAGGQGVGQRPLAGEHVGGYTSFVWMSRTWLIGASNLLAFGWTTPTVRTSLRPMRPISLSTADCTAMSGCTSPARLRFPYGGIALTTPEVSGTLDRSPAPRSGIR